MPFICKSNVELTTSTHGYTMFRNKLEKWRGMDSFYGHCVGNNFLTVEQYMCSNASLVWIRMSCFFFCVWVGVLGCVIIPVRNFKTSHYPHPLPCKFRHNALSDISNWKHTLSQNFKALDSSVKVVMDTTHVTVLYSFLSDASVFGIEPENVGGGLVFEVNFGGI